MDKNSIDEIVDELVETNFINEKRFLSSFVRGKFLSNKWGKNKIRMALRKKHFDDEQINSALQKIDDNEYRKTAEKLVQRKLDIIKNFDRKEKSKLYYYMLSKGYEPDIISDAINGIVPD